MGRPGQPKRGGTMRVRDAGAEIVTLGVVAAAIAATSMTGAAQSARLRPTDCSDSSHAAAPTCADSGARHMAPMQPLPAGDAPEFLRAFVQPIEAPLAWRRIYHE